MYTRGQSNLVSQGMEMDFIRSSLVPQEAYEDRSLLSYSTASIWVVAMAIAVGCAFAGQVFLGAVLLGTVAILHSFFDPRVPLFVLVAVIPLESIISVLPQVTTLSKIVGLWAFLWSIPRIIKAITGGAWDNLAKWVLLLLVWAFIACAWSSDKVYALMYVQTLVLVWALLLLVCVQVRTERVWRELLIVYACSCLLLSLVTLQQGGIGGSGMSSASRMTQQSVVSAAQSAAKVDVNIPARMIGIGVLACVYLFFSSKWKIMKLASVASMVLMAGAIVVYQGRAVYLAVPISLVGSVILLKGSGAAQRILLGIGLSLIGALLVYAMSSMGLLGPGIQERIGSIFEQGTGAGRRNVLWAAHFNAFISTGFIGKGTSSMRWTAESLYHVAHNDALDIMGNLGLVGLVAFVGVHTCFFIRIRRMGVFWPQFFCWSAWLFVVIAGITETDWNDKVGTLPLAIIWAGIRTCGVNELRSSQPSLVNWTGQGYSVSSPYAR